MKLVAFALLGAAIAAAEPAGQGVTEEVSPSHLEDTPAEPEVFDFEKQSKKGAFGRRRKKKRWSDVYRAMTGQPPAEDDEVPKKPFKLPPLVLSEVIFGCISIVVVGFILSFSL